MAIFVLVVSLVMIYMFKVQECRRTFLKDLKEPGPGFDLEDQVFLQKYEFTILLLVIFQSCSSSFT